jgi:hypothetical protein
LHDWVAKGDSARIPVNQISTVLLQSFHYSTIIKSLLFFVFYGMPVGLVMEHPTIVKSRGIYILIPPLATNLQSEEN